MMEASAINNNNLALDTTINNGYLKSSKNYLPTNTPITNEAFTRPRVIQWDPHMGTDQSTISVVLEQAVSDSNGDEIRPMKLVFGQLVVETNQQQQRAPTASPNNAINSQLMWITLVAHVPRFSDTQVESGNQVPLSICVYDHNNRDTAFDHWDFGVFTYNRGVGEKDLRQLKRGASDSISLEYPAKRANTTSTIEDDQLFNQLLAPFEDSPRGNTPDVRHSQQSTMAPLLPQAIGSSSAASSNTYNQTYNNNNQNNSSGLSDYSQQPVNIQPSTPQVSYGSYNNNNMSYSSYTPGYNLTSATTPSHSAMYPNYSQQSMFHTQPIQQQQSQQHQSQQQMISSISNTSSSGQLPPPSSYHPFAGVLSKANLKIMGDLEEMTWNWTPEEWANGRRLVQFWRRQHGASDDERSQEENEVECGFEPIEQEAYQQQRIRENLATQKDATSIAAGQKKKPSPLVISCIYWQERNDYFITSVDCIYLLEGLIGVQFTVEEKNRIRRNLEGFRPLTVSKCKPECADFFKLIMSFPHPKPRNIEKDVKVFAWKTLPTALKKIIRKYTPSYSSTVAVNLNN